MEHAFWHSKWDADQIGFHNPTAHPMLTTHLPTFDLPKDARILVPLCGKSLDLHWLRASGYRLVGVELVEKAVQELFGELDLEPSITQAGAHKHYAAEGIDVFVGDIFTLEPSQIGPIDFVYDRAALIALPLPMRRRYAQIILSLSDGAPQMLIIVEYAQAEMKGPPFAVFEDEIDSHYGASHSCIELERVAVAGKLKGRVEALEIARALHVH